VGLAEAREARTEARRLLRRGIDPAIHRETRRREALDRDANTFEKLAREWHGVKQISWTPNYAENVLHRLESDVFPDVGKRPINDISHRELIDVLRKIEACGAHEIAKRNKAICAQIFSFAIQSGIATRNPIADMKDILQSVTPGNFPAIAGDDLPDFLAALARNEACMHRTAHADARLRAHQ
jgi:hypothetical protein